MPAFDSIAHHYDQEFSQSLTGLLQRNIVRKYLDCYLNHDQSLNILELGCGTGEDALYLARKGHRVLATDISLKMIDIARNKAMKEKPGDSLGFKVLDMRRLEEAEFETSFDLIFSNFGAMNCISPVETTELFAFAHEILDKGGKIIAVIMPRFCAWESFYFVFKGRWREIFRRKKRGGILANIGSAETRTWYYSKRQIKKASASYFDFIRVYPVGFFLPPSYLDEFFVKKRWLLNIFRLLEAKVSRFSFLSGLSDHYVFELKRKE